MKTIYIVGLGPGTLDTIPVHNLTIIENKKPLFLRTKRHPAVEGLERKGIKYSSFDEYYETYSTFEQVYQEITDKLFQSLAFYEEVVYAVPGHPYVAETTVQLIKKRAEKEKIKLVVAPAMSCLDAIYGALGLDPTKGIQVRDALSLEIKALSPGTGLVVTQLYNRQVASDVKLTLMEVYPEEHQVTLVRGAGIPGQERLETIPLYELDHILWIDHLTSLYVAPFSKEQDLENYDLERLLFIMQDLLGEHGCPWDKEQTHDTLKKYLIEECYEVIEAIEEQDMYKLCDELGDLLLQIVFHAELASREGYFNIYDVIKAIVEKMIRRHPHVFGHAQVENSAEVLANWDEIKKGEKREKGQALRLEVPRGLPALQRAQKIQSKAAKIGFDWLGLDGPWQKVEEELKEFKMAVGTKNLGQMKEELGDILFSIVNVARFLDLEAEEALSETNNKFLRRFSLMEDEAQHQGCDLSALSLEEMDILWEKAKEKTKKNK